MVERAVTPKVSVIVPMFNSERYIDKCLTSILDQTFTELEIIVVDDFSTDSGAAIVDELQCSDPRLRLVRHESNIGSSGARNTGIGLAAAAYIAFVDSDDYIDREMIKTLYECVTDNNCDVAICGFSQLDEQQNVLYEYMPKGGIIDLRHEHHNVLEVTNPAPWNKLWKKELFTRNNIYFPDGMYFQDLATTPRLIFKSHRICVLPTPLYRYISHLESVTNTRSDKHITDYFSVFDVIKAFLIEQGVFGEYDDKFCSLVNDNIAFHRNTVLRNFPDDPETASYVDRLDAYRTAYLGLAPQARGVGSDELAATTAKLE